VLHKPIQNYYDLLNGIQEVVGSIPIGSHQTSP
jgi:hypothetical protein